MQEGSYMTMENGSGHFSGWQQLLVLIALCTGMLLPAVLSPSGALAQDGQARVEEYLDRNEDLLEWALELVRETESGPARRVLQEADRIQTRARDLYEQGHPLRAIDLARRSRAAIWQAVRLAREALSFTERLHLRAERFWDQHGHLLDLARAGHDSRALDFIHRAEDHAHRAHEQELQGDPKQAFRMLEQAEKLLRRASRLLADGAGPDRVARSIERAAGMLDRAREAVGTNAPPEALDLLTQSAEALDRAREHRDQGQPGRALQMAGLAGKLAGRAQALVGGGGDGHREQEIRGLIERWDHRFGSVAERVEESGSEAARQQLALARDHRDRAARDLAEGRVEQALRQIRAAHDRLGLAEGMTR